MSTVAEIKAAIARLPLEERAEILADLCGWVDDGWDRRMKSDAAAGRFAELNRAASVDEGADRTIPLADILREP